MSRTSKQRTKDRHHVYPSKDIRHHTEIKRINAEAHKRWHLLVSDMTPLQSVRYIAKNFMPEEMENILLEAIA